MFTDSPTLTSSALEVHLMHQQTAKQWRGFLRVLAHEFASALPPADLRVLMVRVGGRFAAQHGLSTQTGTLPLLQQSMNAIWEPMEWGSVQLDQTPDALQITHQFAPLASAFGLEQADWAFGFLEGVYQAWFAQVGAEQLRVVQVAAADTWGSAVFHLTASTA